MKFQSKYNIKELWFRQIQNVGIFTPFTKEMNRFPEFKIKDDPYSNIWDDFQRS